MKSLCSICKNNACIFQSGIYRKKCDFYIPQITIEEVYVKFTDTAGNFHWIGTKSGEHVIKGE